MAMDKSILGLQLIKKSCGASRTPSSHAGVQLWSFELALCRVKVGEHVVVRNDKYGLCEHDARYLLL